MKKFGLLALILVMIVLIAIPAFADVTLKVANATAGRYEQINFPSGVTVTKDGIQADVVVSGASSTPTITGGTINGATVGVSTPAAGKFTTLQSTGTATLANITNSGTLTGGAITGATFNNGVIGGGIPAAVPSTT